MPILICLTWFAGIVAEAVRMPSSLHRFCSYDNFEGPGLRSASVLISAKSRDHTNEAGE